MCCGGGLAWENAEKGAGKQRGWIGFPIIAPQFHLSVKRRREGEDGEIPARPLSSSTMMTAVLPLPLPLLLLLLIAVALPKTKANDVNNGGDLARFSVTQQVRLAAPLAIPLIDAADLAAACTFAPGGTVAARLFMMEGKLVVCDSASASSPQVVSFVAPAPVCGNGEVEEGEACDDGNDDELDACSNNCVLNFCGDGEVNNGEECDDGNDNDVDACNDSCVINFCGDGEVNNGEACDDGNDNNVDACNNNCVVNFCGDGVVNNGEECDLGSDVPGQCEGCLVVTPVPTPPPDDFRRV